MTPRPGGGRCVAVAAALLGLSVLIGAGVVWWRSLAVEIEIVPDKEVWAPGEDITGKIVVHNWTFRAFRLSQGDLGYVRTFDSRGGRVKRSGVAEESLENDHTRWGEDSPPEVNVARRGSASEDGFWISTDPWSYEGGLWMQRGEFLISLAQDKVTEFSKMLGVPVKLCPARVSVLENASKRPFGRRIIRFGLCGSKLGVLRDDGTMESRELETGKLLARDQLEDGWFERFKWYLDFSGESLHLSCSSDGTWAAAENEHQQLPEWFLKLCKKYDHTPDNTLLCQDPPRLVVPSIRAEGGASWIDDHFEVFDSRTGVKLPDLKLVPNPE